jgi:5-formyltetrahydrofolate cyclo-ligase
MTSQSDIRKFIRSQRAKLLQHEQTDAANKIFAHISHLGLITRHQHFACYLPSRGEVDTHPIIDRIWEFKKRCYLPVLHWSKQNKLQFMPFAPDTTLKKNRYGIHEPIHNASLIHPPWAIDIIFMPLVAFDIQGHRIGMGGGYYDRTLNFLLRRDTWTKPKLVGLAYEFQKVDLIENQPWDVPLNCIITEQAIYKPT